ncbi:transcriptional regulator [Lysinibacillus sp. UGB7]|uniref:transcriptional regulator n=1 Tax=Lysinibacillus sp. UGB7 TaxID=3411039 RepID=UPI003B7E94EB
MKNSILKAMKHNEIMTMIYVSKNGEITQRKVKILKITHDTFTAYCFTRRAKRIFNFNNVLAVAPLTWEELKAYKAFGSPC